MEEFNIKIGESAAFYSTSNVGFTGTLSGWNFPDRIQVNEYFDRIEMIYKQTSMVSNGLCTPEQRVFKIIFSCVDGKWNKSEPIYGKIIPSRDETYEF